MIWGVISLIVLLAGAFLCLATIGRPSWSRIFGPAVMITGCLTGLVPVGFALSGKITPALRLSWNMPFGSFLVEMDPLSAVFAAPILIISALAAVYGASYLSPFEGKKELAISWFFFNLLASSMLLVIVARNAMLFLLAWEIMSLASFFLVIFENEKEHVRRSAWTYLIAAHIGTAFLLVLFALLGHQSGTLDFNGFILSRATPGLASVAFLLAVIGFGTKAGFIPLHVWLPEAHPAAPSHVSAVMSGVMIKTGIYGLVRILTFLGMPPPSWWGWALIGLGTISGILGVVFALAQHDLKRLLAYHSVENIGIIALGLGVGLLGMSYNYPTMAFLGFAGGLLHVINHAVFKSLLFLNAGSVLHASGTRDIEHLGGLLKRMPTTGLTFLIGSAAICGLPPLNGFVSEFMIYLGSFGALAEKSSPPGILAASLIVVGSLALIGGLAIACFTKAFGIIFLGEPRSPHAAHPHEAGPTMRIPMVTLAAICIIFGLSGPFLIKLLESAVGIITGGKEINAQINMAWITNALWMVTALTAGILGVASLLALIRYRLLSRRTVNDAVTWDCGYVAPTPKMQYTASSFADPIIRMFRIFLRTKKEFNPPTGLFPVSSSFSSETPDVYKEHMYKPLFSVVENMLAKFRWLQHGRLNLYILCIVLALLALLAWKLR